MSNFVIKKATRKAKKLRIGFSAASGFGKTKSALRLAYGLTGDWSKICVIDSEKDSASLYADMGEYSTVNISAPYTPERYIEAIKTVENAGFECIIIDSITHEWAGEGGCLEIQTNLGGRFQDWGKVTPRHNAFISAILTSKCHVITTVRRKQEYGMNTENGKSKVEKLGMGEVTRDGFEYELDLNFEITNENHLSKASKDRTGLFMNKPEFLVTEETGQILLEWSNQGLTETLDEAMEKVRNCSTEDELKMIYNSYKSSIGSNEDFVTSIKKKKEEILQK